MIATFFGAIQRHHPVKRLESLLNSRTFLIFFPLTILFLWGFFVGPIHGLLNQFVLAGLIRVAIIFAIAGLFFFFTLWLIGPHVLPTQLLPGTLNVLRLWYFNEDPELQSRRELALLSAAMICEHL